jgi:hypothetical protein
MTITVVKNTINEKIYNNEIRLGSEMDLMVKDLVTFYTTTSTA